MPKMKTNKSLAKRVRVSKSGKIRFKKQGLRHILTSRTRKSKRQARTTGFVHASDRGRVLRGLPNG